MTSHVSTFAPAKSIRPDIQSLRALAISLVLAAHAHVSWLQGGYVGVDAFFVLSGYLISGLILNEIEATRQFNAWRFYARRLKRLLPGLLLLLFCTAAAAYVLSSPWAQLEDASSAQAVSLWLGNFYFVSRQIGYFSSGLNTYLLLHTWSLAVEEQLYLVWPWLLLFAMGIWQWQGALFSRKRLATGLTLTAAASFALNLYWAKTNPDMDFYLMPSRMWEFALGGLLYLLREACDAGRLPKLDTLRGRSLLNGAGWLTLIVVATQFTADLRYPGWWALLPGLGAGLILLDAPEKQTDKWFSRFTLQQPGLQYLGDISYSAYLWHWPVLLLGTHVLGTDWPVRAALVGLGLLLASTAYHLVENPLRCKPLRHTWKVLASAGLAMVAGFSAMSVWQQQAKELMHSHAQEKVLVAQMDVPSLYNQPCDTWYHSSALSICTFGPLTATHKVVMFGDSVLAQWFPAILDLYVKQQGWQLVVLTKSSCSAQRVSYYYPRIKTMYTVCDAWREKAISYITKLHPSTVIMGSTNYDFTPKQWILGTQSVLKQISPASGQVIIMAPTPDLGFNGLRCLSERLNWPHWLATKKPCVAPINHSLQDRNRNLLTEAAAPYPDTRVVSLDSVICPNGLCRASVGNRIVYRDGKHLTASFVRSLTPVLARELEGTALPGLKMLMSKPHAASQ